MQEQMLYENWVQPTFAPPAWVFGPVWTVLYVLIVISFGYALWRIVKGKDPKNYAWLFIVNLIANAAFTYIQFGLQNFVLAFVDILIVLGTIIGIVAVYWNRNRFIAAMQIPYLLWVSFASVLQLSVTILNI